MLWPTSLDIKKPLPLNCSALNTTFPSWLNLRALVEAKWMDDGRRILMASVILTLSNVARGESFNIFWSCIIKQICRKEGISVLVVEENSMEREPVDQSRFLSYCGVSGRHLPVPDKWRSETGRKSVGAWKRKYKNQEKWSWSRASDTWPQF